MSESPCPGCGLELPEVSTPSHRYIGASPACWALFGEVLAREYEDAAYFRVHQLTVDAYAAQHPGRPSRQSIRSVALHLATIALVVEQGADPAEGPRLHKRLARGDHPGWLEPPADMGSITVADVSRASDPDAHEAVVRAWAGSVWRAWSAHHETIRKWTRVGLEA